MPCDEWQKLADKAKEAKLQRDYLASTEVTDIGAYHRKKKLRVQSQTTLKLAGGRMSTVISVLFARLSHPHTSVISNLGMRS